MRTLRLSVVGMVILALLGAMGGAVMAQDEPAAMEEFGRPAEEAPVTATHVTGTPIDHASDDSAVENWTDERGVEHYHGFRASSTDEWSDPRLPSETAMVENYDIYQTDDGSQVVGLSAVRLDGPGGSWTGTATSLYSLPDGTGTGLMVLTGEGAYEGLFAVLEGDPTGWDGYICEGEMPPMPDPPEPPAE
jgi:hypothetical protein